MRDTGAGLFRTPASKVHRPRALAGDEPPLKALLKNKEFKRRTKAVERIKKACNGPRAQFNPSMIRGEADVHVVAALLQDFFVQLKQPLFSSEGGMRGLWVSASRCDNPLSRLFLVRTIVESHSTAHRATMEFMLKYLRSLALQSEAQRRGGSGSPRAGDGGSGGGSGSAYADGDEPLLTPPAEAEAAVLLSRAEGLPVPRSDEQVAWDDARIRAALEADGTGGAAAHWPPHERAPRMHRNSSREERHHVRHGSGSGGGGGGAAAAAGGGGSDRDSDSGSRRGATRGYKAGSGSADDASASDVDGRSDARGGRRSTQGGGRPPGTGAGDAASAMDAATAASAAVRLREQVAQSRRAPLSDTLLGYLFGPLFFRPQVSVDTYHEEPDETFAADELVAFMIRRADEIFDLANHDHAVRLLHDKMGAQRRRDEALVEAHEMANDLIVLQRARYSMVQHTLRRVRMRRVLVAWQRHVQEMRGRFSVYERLRVLSSMLQTEQRARVEAEVRLRDAEEQLRIARFKLDVNGFVQDLKKSALTGSDAAALLSGDSTAELAAEASSLGEERYKKLASELNSIAQLEARDHQHRLNVGGQVRRVLGLDVAAAASAAASPAPAFAGVVSAAMGTPDVSGTFSTAGALVRASPAPPAQSAGRGTGGGMASPARHTQSSSRGPAAGRGGGSPPPLPMPDLGMASMSVAMAVADGNDTSAGGAAFGTSELAPMTV